MKITNRVRILSILLLQFVLLLIWGGYRYKTLDGFYGEYRGVDDKYFSVYGENDALKDGYFVDESFGKEGVFTCGPYLKLPKGIYQITVFYEAIGTGHTCAAYDEDSEYFALGLKGDTIILNQEQTVKSFAIWVERELEYFEIRTYYGGNGSLLIKQIVIEEKSVGAVYPVVKTALLIVLIDLVAIYIYMVKKRLLSTKSAITALILFGVICIASAPALKSNMVNAYEYTDFHYWLMRIEGLKDGILAGNIPVRIQPNWLNGYGYATSVFYGDLLLGFPAFLRIMGFSIQETWNIYVILINTTTCLIFYFCTKGIFKSRTVAILGSTLFTLSSYRLAHLIVSPKGGTTLALIMVPLVVYGMYLVFYNPKSRKSWLCISIGMTGAIQSHLLTCAVVAMAIALTILLGIRKFMNKYSIVSMIKAVVASAILNLWFLIAYMDYMNEDLYISSDAWKLYYNNIQRKGVDLSDYLNFYKEAGMKTTVDLILLVGLVAFIAICVLIPKEKISVEKIRYRKIGIVTSIVSGLFLFMSSKYFPWDFITERFEFSRTYVNSIQFPAQRIQGVTCVLLIVVVCCAFAILKELLKEEEYKIGLMGVLLVTLATSVHIISYAINNKENIEIYDAAALDSTRISTQVFISTYAEPEVFVEETALARAGIKITKYEKKRLDVYIECENMLLESSAIEVPLYFYKGYRAVDNEGNMLELIPNDKYTILVEVPGGYEGNIHIYFKEPIVWTISFWVSVVSAILIFGTQIILTIKERKRDEKSINHCQP